MLACSNTVVFRLLTDTSIAADQVSVKSCTYKLVLISAVQAYVVLTLEPDHQMQQGSSAPNSNPTPVGMTEGSKVPTLPEEIQRW